MTYCHQNCCRDEDREFFEREVASFLPDRIFDAHCHLAKWGQLEMLKGQTLPESFNHDMGYHEYHRLIDCLHPGRQVAALFISGPLVKDMLSESNEFVGRETAKDSLCRGLFFVTPQDDPEWVRDEVRRLGLHGLKCYHSLAKSAQTWELDIPEYLPEGLVKVADEEKWVITLHMVKSRAVADPGNIHWIRYYCRKYPNMKLILAHSARGFQPAHNLEGLPQLKGLDNLYFDTSANCEPIAHESIIRIMGHKRLMYGSDFCAGPIRGRSVSAGDSFVWLYEENPVWNEKHMQVKPVLLGLESLRSLKWACWSARLKDTAIEDIFWNNAAELFGLK